MGVPVRLDNLLRGMLHVTEVHVKQRRELHKAKKKMFVNHLFDIRYQKTQNSTLISNPLKKL
jgi:hypothetical protein